MDFAPTFDGCKYRIRILKDPTLVVIGKKFSFSMDIFDLLVQ